MILSKNEVQKTRKKTGRASHFFDQFLNAFFLVFWCFFNTRSHTNILCSGTVLILIRPRIGDPPSGIRGLGGSFNSIPRGPFEASRGLFRTEPFRTESLKIDCVFCTKQPRPFGASRKGPFETSRGVRFKHPGASFGSIPGSTCEGSRGGHFEVNAMWWVNEMWWVHATWCVNGMWWVKEMWWLYEWMSWLECFESGREWMTHESWMVP